LNRLAAEATSFTDARHRFADISQIPKSPLPTLWPLCNARRAMTKKLMALCLLSTWLVGCVHNTVTNLTATTQPRDPTGQYRVEYEWDSTQQTVLPNSIKPVVVVGFDTYEMKRVLNTSNRWEAFVPVPKDKDQIVYQFKVDYEYSRFGKPGKASKLSPQYKLTVK
jgi:hypothetical protein